jgi:DNA-binding NtrC family response regulator
MQQLRRLLARIAPAQPNVVILGETGTGKDVIARAIHRKSSRSAEPFIVFDCASVAPTLIESELFGHARGAFTGALSTRVGAFEQADGGTIFLDEIGDLPQDVQPKLLRVLENGTIKRVGESAYRRVDVRVIAATHRDLAVEVREGRFRSDLFYRLSVMVVRVPALRERLQDVPLLARHFARELGHRPDAIREQDMSALCAHSWPGNVRELRNEVERLLVMPEASSRTSVLPPPSGLSEGMSVPAAKREAFEARRVRIVEALARRAGNQKLAAQDLGVSRRTLLNWLDEHGFPRPRKGSS